ncbi:YceI-like domain-containing protein [Flavobacterium fluvii]|uniref:YceI-like domain-containing protein n=1 Tax=Flavobacterium fluvii TaxID=468056 RepID=A0A1M5L0L7_9FLAO|nr:YceI family protein [Flavobacterium fluvii]SHG58624.1 YceI-like domain-containing protein [Flavobacterium fluvii]
MTTSQISKSFTILLASILFTISGVANAQNASVISQNSSFIVHGTSTIHEWDMKTTKFNGELGLNAAKQINAASIKVEVKSLKSGKDGMDDKAYEAFDIKKNPYITFQLTEVSPVKLSEGDTEVTLTGNLTTAGTTRKVSFKTIAKITKSGDYQLKGSLPLKMTDFKMKPPTAMFGTIKSGDAVTIKFDVTFKG